MYYELSFFFQAEDGIRDDLVTGVQTCALPIFRERGAPRRCPGGRRELRVRELARVRGGGAEKARHRRDRREEFRADLLPELHQPRDPRSRISGGVGGRARWWRGDAGSRSGSAWRS